MTPDDTGVSSDWGFCLVFSCEYLLLRQTRVQGWCGCDGVPLGCQQCPVPVPVPGAEQPAVAGGIWHIREHPMDPAGLCAWTEAGGERGVAVLAGAALSALPLLGGST